MMTTKSCTIRGKATMNRLGTNGRAYRYKRTQLRSKASAFRLSNCKRNAPKIFHTISEKKALPHIAGMILKGPGIFAARKRTIIMSREVFARSSLKTGEGSRRKSSVTSSLYLYIIRYMPSASSARRHTEPQSNLSTARKAFCGTCTLPICFILFLPFFCFSSNLRLRLMSPP